MTNIPPPPPTAVDTEGRFARWTYQFWDYVAKNRLGAANARITGTNPVLVASSGTSSFAISHATSSVVAGTYGGGLVIPQFTVNAFGHVISATNGGTAGTGGGGGISAIVGAVSGTSTTGTLTAAYTGTLVGAGDVLGTSTTGTFTAALSTTGVTAGTFGGTAGIPRFDIGADGRVKSGLNVIISATAPILHGTPGTGTVSFSLSTTGVGTGLPGTTVLTYEGLDAFGRSTSVGTIADFSITGTATAGGIYGTRAVQAAVGSSASVANAVVAPYVNANPVSLTTVAGTLMKYGLPASALAGSGQAMYWRMWGTMQLGPANGRWALTFGTATLLVATSTIAPCAWIWEGDLTANSSTQQEYQTRFDVFTNAGVGLAQYQVGTLGMNLSTVTTLCIVGTGTTANNLKTQRGMVVQVYGLQ